MSGSELIQVFLEDCKSIQMSFLNFLENVESNEENFQNLNQLFEITKIRDCQHNLRLFLHLLLKVSNNHYREPNFFNNINRIFQLFKDDIKKYFSNSEIFTIFKSNKRILLLLIEEKILTVDEYFVKQIIQEKYLSKKYPQYFSPEIKPFMNKKWFPKYETTRGPKFWIKEIAQELPNNFYELRKIGENENYLCKLIRDDEIKDFIVYVNKNQIPLNAKINLSIYETNSYLIKKCLLNELKISNVSVDVTLIEYAAFYGSDKIFRFLMNEGVVLKPSLWLDVIHGKNPELIHLLEDYNVEPTVKIYSNYKKIDEKSYIGCLIESIKCHHNDIANYIINKYLKEEDENSNKIFVQSLECYNHSFIKNKHINESSLRQLCLYDYYLFVKVLLTNKNIDINSTGRIQNYFFK